MELTKAYDLKVFGERLKNKGLIEGEDLAVGIYAEAAKWIQESAVLSKNPWDDIGAPFLSSVKGPIVESIDKISEEQELNEMPKAEDLLVPVAAPFYPLAEAYDFEVLIERLKYRGLKEVEDLARQFYAILKVFLTESAMLSENKLDDIAVPFLSQLDAIVIPQIEKIHG
jgi:hypothetical protein